MMVETDLVPKINGDFWGITYVTRKMEKWNEIGIGSVATGWEISLGSKEACVPGQRAF